MGLRDAGRQTETGSWLQAGAIAGAGAFLIGYVLTGVAVLLHGLSSGGSDDPNAAAMVSQLPQFVGTVFYDAHYVDLQFDIDQAVGTTGVISELDLLFPAGVFYVVPVGVLVLAGFALVRRGPAVGSVRAATIRGAGVVLSYLPLVAVCATLVAVDVTVSEFEITLSPNLRLAVARAGLFYPLVFGALGGLLAFALTDADDRAN